LKIYIPKKNSQVDNALAGYLNKMPEKSELKILFLRETEGVYRFGTRQVYIKVEKGDRVTVRVGGGFIDIDEFLKQYTETEFTRLHRKRDCL